MHNYWIFKTDPSHSFFKNLLKDRKVTWKPVKNTLALKELRNVKRGDVIIIYHNGEERQIILWEKIMIFAKERVKYSNRIKLYRYSSIRVYRYKEEFNSFYLNLI
ncbi:MAG: hypothetical protein A2V93_02300 [Ignavibacteria bacterium RBG_16_34_14]|nr:MAG: hypothetical protein A2V93_02300 [Ignavibacteria bacterium RBG_16_34_14]